jgi:NADPH2:quinone reductase
MIAFGLMRAIVVREFGGPEVLRLEDVATLEPGPGQVLVKIGAAGVNPVDGYIRTGTYPQKPALPYTPGADGAGEVVAAGSGVTGVKAGDRVYIANDNVGSPRTGTYAEQALCAATQLHPLPPTVSFQQGAALGVPYVTAYRALMLRGQAKPGEILLVHGASGGVGLAALQFARTLGMTVIGTAGTARGLDVVREQGAQVAINHAEAGYTDAIMKATGGRGADLILEMAAHINLDKDLTMLAKFGRVVVVGSRGRVEIDPRGTMGRDASIHGLTIFNATPSELTTIHAAIGAGLANGMLKPVVSREWPLAEAAQAQEAVAQPGAYGKIVLVP